MWDWQQSQKKNKRRGEERGSGFIGAGWLGIHYQHVGMTQWRISVTKVGVALGNKCSRECPKGLDSGKRFD